mmetsp:Transcript_75456/g.233423  ORF Transcript_75456/g.233423 Transcript_75456/m.233423 type:complete len:560 (-) Transcript_75456:202-1881(-)|eukprot:CAMPEP_0204584210 /NCGR_PEP_ID=MMETSP0661-20131031/46207_1 /ASSEMBLY_ACC=CAM_ASM_000606 /TAXON_ID=109239 /ORGANISM="Alexandrium margalefi, Strain AMGDE01CS-322" /LENGTH=559 /DNA_ID=CAMNT_0051593635 /DNA_START=59 /DNA_END=1738 /DNA_ORIENTATION=-
MRSGLRGLTLALTAAALARVSAEAPSGLNKSLDRAVPHPWRPNIVLFLQDDQDEYLGGWGPMRRAEESVAQQGARAKNFFIHTPVCCPSRAELLSGRYFHNVRMQTPKGGCMHVNVGKVNPSSFATYLTQAGYTAGWFGKHMNTCPHEPPPGFGCATCYWFTNGGGNDEEPGGYLNATFNDFVGGVARSGTRYHRKPGLYYADTSGEFAGYYTSVIANKSLEWVRKVGRGPAPFFVAVASKGPHVPSTPAPWYAHAFSERSAPRTPDYNASAEQLANHHWLIAQQGPITPEEGREIDELFRNRWRTLLSVDDAIAGMVEVLDELGIANSTYVLITSDHGFNLGQHRLPSCKLNVYDHDIRIPLIIRGPGISAGGSFEEPASNVDIAPTILGLAGLDGYDDAEPPMDGRSFAPLVVNPRDTAVPPSTRRHLEHERARRPLGQWRKHHLVEYYSLGSVVRTGHLVDDPISNTYRALRFTIGGPVGSGNMLYAEFTAVEDWNFSAPSFTEVFDLERDPHQLTNLARSVPAGVKAQLHEQLKAQWGCAGKGCEAVREEALFTV